MKWDVEMRKRFFFSPLFWKSKEKSLLSRCLAEQCFPQMRWDLLLLFHFICTQCLHRGWKSQTLWMRSTWNRTKQLVHIDHSSRPKWPRSNPFPQERWLFLLSSRASHFSCEVRCSDGNIFNSSSSQVLIDWSQGYRHPLPLRWKNKSHGLELKENVSWISLESTNPHF